MHPCFLLLLSAVLIQSLPANIHILEDSSFKLPVGKGTKVYFLSNGAESDLKQITIRADKSNINTNVFAYAIPQTDGSLNPLMITADDDTLVVTRPDGNNAQVSLYRNNITQNLNVFPIFEKSSIQFKSGVNVFFNVDKPANRILTLKNLNLENSSGRVIASSGVPGDAHPYVFFDSDTYPANKVYKKLNIPLVTFQLNQIDSGVSYQVEFHKASTSLDQSGVLMTQGYPLNRFPSDLIYSLNTNGEQVSLRMTPYFYSAIPYSAEITVYFNGGLSQGNNFPSVANGKLTASGDITQVEIDCEGPYALQYYISQNGTSSTTRPSRTTVLPVITTTRSSNVFQILLSLTCALISFLI